MQTSSRDIETLMELSSKLREGGRIQNQKSSERMVARELKRNPPSEYSVGDNVTIKVAVPKAGGPQRSKRSTDVILTGIVKNADRDKHLYEVSVKWGYNECLQQVPNFSNG